MSGLARVVDAVGAVVELVGGELVEGEVVVEVGAVVVVCASAIPAKSGKLQAASVLSKSALPAVFVAGFVAVLVAVLVVVFVCLLRFVFIGVLY